MVGAPEERELEADLDLCGSVVAQVERFARFGDVEPVDLPEVVGEVSVVASADQVHQRVLGNEGAVEREVDVAESPVRLEADARSRREGLFIDDVLELDVAVLVEDHLERVGPAAFGAEVRHAVELDDEARADAILVAAVGCAVLVEISVDGQSGRAADAIAAAVHDRRAEAEARAVHRVVGARADVALVGVVRSAAGLGIASRRDPIGGHAAGAHCHVRVAHAVAVAVVIERALAVAAADPAHVGVVRSAIRIGVAGAVDEA